MNALTTLSQATRMLAEAKDFQDVKKIMDMAEAARVYARAAKMGLEAQNHAAEIKLRAERKAGELLAQLERGTPGPKELHSSMEHNSSPYAEALEAEEIARTTAHRWQKIATLPDEEFEEYITSTKGRGDELTSGGAYKISKQAERAEQIQQQINTIEAQGIVSPSGLYDVIVIDPPWPYGTQYDPAGRRAANPYPEMSLDEIKGMEIPASPDAVLWLWTTHKFMRHSFEIIDAWGFRDVSILTWVKNRMGLGSWLRSQSEFCVMCVRGKPIIRLSNQTTIVNGPLREHSRKPDEFYQLVESLCVGRKMDMFSREERPGWSQYGNDTEKFK